MVTAETLAEAFQGEFVEPHEIYSEALQIKTILEGQSRLSRRQRPRRPAEIFMHVSGVVLSVRRVSNEIRSGYRMTVKANPARGRATVFFLNIPDGWGHLIESSPPIIPTDRVRAYGPGWFHGSRPVVEVEHLSRDET